MRVTTNMNTQTLLNSINKNQASISDLQIQLSSENKVNTPSDAPESISRILNKDVSLNKVETYLNNIDTLNGEIEVSDGVLDQVNTALRRVLELTTEAANGTNSSDTLEIINDEIKQIKEQLVDLANTKYSGNYIYAGTKTGVTPFVVQDDGSVVYQGTPSSGDWERACAISDGVKQNVNLNGESVFGYSIYNTETEEYEGEGVMQLMNNIITAIGKEPSDFDAIRENLDSITSAQDTVLLSRTKLGAVQNRLEMTTEQHENNKITLETLKEQLQSADLADVVTQLSQQQTALQASLYASSSTMQISMLDYI